MITKDNTGIKVNSRMKLENAAAASTNDEDSDSAVASTSSGVTNDNLSAMNAAALAAAAEFAANFTKDFSVDAIMMKREPSELGLQMPDLKLLEELQKKVNFAVNPDLFSTIRQMNPIKYWARTQKLNKKCNQHDKTEIYKVEKQNETKRNECQSGKEEKPKCET